MIVYFSSASVAFPLTALVFFVFVAEGSLHIVQSVLNEIVLPVILVSGFCNHAYLEVESLFVFVGQDGGGFLYSAVDKMTQLICLFYPIGFPLRGEY